MRRLEHGNLHLMKLYDGCCCIHAVVAQRRPHTHIPLSRTLVQPRVSGQAHGEQKKIVAPLVCLPVLLLSGSTRPPTTTLRKREQFPNRRRGSVAAGSALVRIWGTHHICERFTGPFVGFFWIFCSTLISVSGLLSCFQESPARALCSATVVPLICGAVTI